MMVMLTAVQFCAVPEALMPVGYDPAAQFVGEAASAVAVAAFPLVLFVSVAELASTICPLLLVPTMVLEVGIDTPLIWLAEIVPLPGANETPDPRLMVPLRAFAVIAPLPIGASDAPVPTNMAAVVFVPPATELKAGEVTELGRSAATSARKEAVPLEPFGAA